MRKKAHLALPEQGLLFDLPPVINRVRLGLPSARAVEALKYVNRKGIEGAKLLDFGRWFYGHKGWVGLQLKIQSLAYMRILIKKGWVYSEVQMLVDYSERYFLTTAGEQALKSVTEI